jgi:hypothetical protein
MKIICAKRIALACYLSLDPGYPFGIPGRQEGMAV